MKKMKRMMAAGLTAAMAAAMLTACGGKDSGNTGGENKDGGSGSKASGELQVNIWDGYQRDGLQEIADEWTKESVVSVIKFK